MTNASDHRRDQTRFVQWLNEHGGAVRGYLRGVLRCPDQAEDLVQEVFQRAWQARANYREEGTARAYLLRIADRLACDSLRKRRREVTVDDATWGELEPADENTDFAMESLAGAELGSDLAAAMALLSTPQRRVLMLRYYGELNFDEIAASLDCPLNTALSHCRRGLLALRKILTENHS